jgi:alanine dehydrogenase
MSGTLLLGRREVAELLPLPDCIEAVEEAFRAQAHGRALPSASLGVRAPGGGLHVKAAGLWRSRLYIAAKLNANFPDNPGRGLPTIQGLLTLFDGEDGQVLAVMDSMEITALRTAAATAVAARSLARTEAAVLALVGCGTQAAYQVRALAAVRPIRRVVACDRDPARARQLAAELRRDTLQVELAGDVRAALRGSEIVVTCTPSKQAIVGPDDVGPGTFVAAVGADNPEKQELDPLLLARARVVVDSLEQAATGGDLHHALEAGVLERAGVAGELWELVAGAKAGRTSPDEITVFDSTGVALEDVAAAAVVYERALRSGTGTRLSFGNGGLGPAPPTA